MLPQTAVKSSPADAPRRRRRWPWFLLAGVIFFLACPLVLYWVVTHTSANDARAVEAETDLLDPGWRLDDIQAQRETLKDDENSAELVVKVVGLAGNNGILYRKENQNLFDNLGPAHELHPLQEALLREAYEKSQGALVEARKLKDMPKGRHKLIFTADFFSTNLTTQQNSRRVFEMLQHDAWLRAQGGDVDGALESCRAGLNAARSIGDEPLLISFLIRVSGDSVALTALERTLAQGRNPAENELAKMQALIEQEIVDVQHHWRNALRGERAGEQRLMTAIQSGKIKVSSFLGGWGGGQASFGERVADDFPGLIVRDYPLLLRYMNEAVAVAEAPVEQQHDQLRELEQKLPKNSILCRLLLPALQKVGQAHVRDQAMLRSAQVAVAAERFRLRNGDRWPETLADLEKAGLLSKVPADPYDGAPMRWHPWAEGRVAYSVGMDKIDNGGNIDRTKWIEPGMDIGFKLWDTKLRRQAPRAPVLEPDQGP